MTLTGPAYGANRASSPRLRLVTPAEKQVLTVAEAKAYARVEVTTDDTVVLPMLIGAATSRIEHELRRRPLVDQVWEAAYPASPGLSSLELPYAGVHTIEVVSTYDTLGVATEWDDANYTLDVGDPDHPLLQLTDNTGGWPLGDRAWSPFVVQFTVGYGEDEADVPHELRMAVGELVAAAYDDRGALSAPLSDAVRQLIAPFIMYGNIPGAGG